VSFFDRVRALLRDSVLTESVSVAPIDSDEDLFRRVTQSPRDLSPIEQDRMLKLAAYLYQRNPVARRLIEIQRDFVLGEGLSVYSDDPEIDEVVKRMWQHPWNNWAVKGVERFTDLRLFGEAIWRIEEMPGSGTLLFYPIDPSDISALEIDETYEPVWLDVRPFSSTGTKKRYKVIRWIARTDGFDDDATGYDGVVFYFAINKLATSTRGISDLFALMDYIDGVDQLSWSALERAKLSTAMVWDVTVKGGDDTAVDKEVKRIRESNVTRPGGVNVHSDGITWAAVTPQLAAADNETMTRQFMRLVLGGVGLSEYHFADASNSNRATAQEQSDPTTKRFTAIQNHWVACLNTVLRYQYQRAQAKGVNLPKLSFEVAEPWKIAKPDMSSKDMAKVAAVITQFTSALSEGESRDYISRDTARAGFITMLKLLGIDTDPQAEADKIAAQPRRAGDYERTPPSRLTDAVRGANAKANNDGNPIESVEEPE
jgi:hypothetical protein